MSCNQNSLDPQTLLKRLEDVEKTLAEKDQELRKLVATAKEVKTMTELENKTLTDEPIKEPTPAPAPIEEPVTKTESDEPRREDFECPVEFNKTYTTWLNKKQAETPVTKADLEKLIVDLKAELLKAVPDVKLEGDLTIGEAIKKSVPVRRDTESKIDYNKWLKSATEVSASAVTMEAK